MSSNLRGKERFFFFSQSIKRKKIAPGRLIKAIRDCIIDVTKVTVKSTEINVLETRKKKKEKKNDIDTRKNMAVICLLMLLPTK